MKFRSPTGHFHHKPPLTVAYFTKWFQSIFTVGGRRMYPFNLPLLAPAYISTQSCKSASFWNPNPTRARHLFLKPDSGLKAKFTDLPKELRYAQLRSNKKRCVQVQLQVHGLSHQK